MSLPSLRDDFQEATGLLDLARRLGELCLDRGGELSDLLAEPSFRSACDMLEMRLAAIDPDEWETPTPEHGFAHLFERDGIDDLVADLRSVHPLEYLGALRGLCRRAVPQFYVATEDRVVLDRGCPVPFVSRPVNLLFRTTPHQNTLTHGHLLIGARLFDRSAHGSVQVFLDFSVRDRLDAITWSRSQRLPRVATIHPFLGDGLMEIGEQTADWFFDVQPTQWDPDAILSQLRAVRDAEIAVLPELCLPVASALEDALAQDPDQYPALVVAGSAHVRERGESGREIRANESRIYLDGVRVATHRKVHPFVTKVLGGRRFERAVQEGLTPEQKTITVLSGTHTRLAVVICADLNDATIPTLLEQAGVNVLLVPALTSGAGAFNGAICGLASRCQAVSVVVNAELDPLPDVRDGERPFLAMAAVPRPDAREQSREYGDRPLQRPGIGLLDPNAPLDSAMTWLNGARAT